MTCKARLIDEFKTRRQALGQSLKEIAERCGIDERFLGDWECGTGSPRLDAVERWAGALGLKLSLAPQLQDARPGLRVDWQRHCVTVDGTPVRLTPMEWKALERLAAAPGQLVSHHELFRHLYGADQPYRAQSTAIRVLITKLRRLLPLRIEAQWGRGYVLSGIEPSTPRAPDAPAASPARCDDRSAGADKGRRDSFAVVTGSGPPSRDASAMRGRVVAINGSAALRRPTATASQPSACRAEELGVIERFLAERGVTRCPDVATIQHAPLPTLIWDKVKRKWVRPAIAEQRVG